MVNLTKQEVACIFMGKVVFEVISKFDKKISFTEGKYNHVCKRHPRWRVK